MAVAGKVAITLSTENGGAWSASVTYDRLVAVTHNNNLYISRKTVANVEPPNDEYWFLALEGFSGEDIENIISGETVVGNANLLEGLTAKQVGASGARNLLRYPYSETTVTKAGIDATDNGDGTITLTGTSTASPYVFMCRTRSEANGLILKAGTYTVSGCPSGGSNSTYNLQVARTADDNFNLIGKEYGERLTFTLTEDTQIQIGLYVMNGVTVNNLTFKPMLEVGSVAHDFVPYLFGGAEKAKEADNAKTLGGHGAEYFAPLSDLSGAKILTELPEGITNESTMQELIDALPYNSILVSSGAGNSNHKPPLLPKDYSGLIIFKPRGVYTIAFTKSQYDNFISVGGIGTNNKWQGWTELNLANYLPKTGGMVGNGIDNYPIAAKGGSAYSFVEFLKADDTALGALGMYGIDKPSFIVSGRTKVYDLLHTGNKPTGTYTGNGSATARTINTGGIGDVCVINTSYGYTFLVSNHGAFGQSGQAGAMLQIKSSEFKFVSGVLHIATTSEYLNRSGTTYTYQVL